MPVPTLFEVLDDRVLAARSRRFAGARWLTWSRPFRALLREHRAWARLLEPAMIHLARAREYSYTYTVTAHGWKRSAFHAALRPFVDDLLRFDPGTSVYFLTSLATKADGWTLHTLFAALRAAMASAAGDAWAAMYAPLANVGQHAGDFPLHADLYRPDVLLNAFEAVPNDGSGRTTLLPANEFFALLRTRDYVPASVRHRIVELLTAPLSGDAYTEFYDLLHGNDNAWTARLERDLRARQRVIALHKYEGYLLHDRRWLHGREAPSGSVAKNRLRRLIYHPAGD